MRGNKETLDCVHPCSGNIETHELQSPPAKQTGFCCQIILPHPPHTPLPFRNLIKTAIWPCLFEPLLHSVTTGQHNENTDAELETRVRYC